MASSFATLHDAKEVSATEERIIDAARKRFGEEGIGKTRLEDIAIEAKLSRQTIYKYFSGKQDIVDQICYLEMLKINEQLRGELDRDKNFPERLCDAIVRSVEISLDNFYICKTVDELNTISNSAQEHPGLLAWQGKLWEPMLTRAASAGEIDGELKFDELLRWIMSCQMMLMINYRHLVASGLDVARFVRRFMVESILRFQPVDTALSQKVDRVTALEAENQSLRALVSEQALELFRLREGTGV